MSERNTPVSSPRGNRDGSGAPGYFEGNVHTCREAMVRHLDAAFASIGRSTADGQELELQASAGSTLVWMVVTVEFRLDNSTSVSFVKNEKLLTNEVKDDSRWMTRIGQGMKR